MGVTPLQIEQMTLDQAFMMFMKIEGMDDKKKKVSLAQAVQDGVVKPKNAPAAFGGKSYFQRVRDKLSCDKANTPTESKRSRRQQRVAELKERIERGEV